MVIPNNQPEILRVENLITRFRTPIGTVHAVNGVSFCLHKGETLGVVGESGCGKSVTMMSIMQLIPNPPGKVIAGKAIYHGEDLLKLPRKEIRRIRGREIGMIFQDPMTSLNPVLTIGQQIAEPLRLHQKMSYKEAQERVIELLTLVGMPEPHKRLGQFPYQFSGGMSQRVMIAMSIACNPSILIADEPTTALDVTIQAQIIELVKQLRDELGMAIIWITHHLGIIAGIAQRVVVMYAGYIIEEASVKELFSNPQHPYTIGLLKSVPRLDTIGHQRLKEIPGLPPVLFDEPKGCPFNSRCPYVFEKCIEKPPFFEVGIEHRSACWWSITKGRPRND